MSTENYSDNADFEENKRHKNLKHHEQDKLCVTRPLYRQGKKLTAVKVYTINNESQHLLIFGVPIINLRTELKQLCSKYGPIKSFGATNEYSVEIFTECYHICYEKIQSARIAKRFLDTKSFYGGILHVCYAPELETVDQTRQKLIQRKRDVFFKTINQSKKRKLDQDCTVNKIEHDICNLKSKDIQKNYENTLKKDLIFIEASKKSANLVQSDNRSNLNLPASTNAKANPPVDYSLCQPVTEWTSPTIIKKSYKCEQKINKIIFRNKNQNSA